VLKFLCMTEAYRLHVHTKYWVLQFKEGHGSVSCMFSVSATTCSNFNYLVCNLYHTHHHDIRSFHSCHQQYDTQLFIALNPCDPSSDITNLTICLATLQSSFCLNGMALNPDKSDTILLGTRQRSSYTPLGSVDAGVAQSLCLTV